ncbi:PepSY domain-containing protein [Streptococcus dentiloxodontae]
MTKIKTRKLSATVAGAALALSASAIIGVSSASAATQTVTADQAKAIALQDAGVSESNTTALKVHSDSDNNSPVYEIEFKVNGSEYDYTVSAVDGAITEKDNDIDDSNSGNGNQANGAAKTISSNDAKAIALKDAGLSEANVTALKVHPDSDNDTPVYEIEFKNGKTEYDYTVNAVTGAITEKDID